MKRFAAIWLSFIFALTSVVPAQQVRLHAAETENAHDTKRVMETENVQGTGKAAVTESALQTESASVTEGAAETEEAKTDNVQAQLDISAPSAVLMEASTGTVIWEKDADTQRHPASITKIMTLILIFDALEEGSISLDDTVITSKYAASMGGSQVFLEAQEQQTVETMIKCIAVASANDACVAMAEHICGSAEEFVVRMNERAAGLGMTSTHFENCNGLDSEQHLTSARDVALMSRELITKYPQIHDYSTIWMENITHVTSKGTKDFGLTNTNKLIRQHPYATGLKTGSTGLAKYCVSATAEKDGVELIAVIMAAPDYKVRFQDATTLLNYGFAKIKVYNDEEVQEFAPVKVLNGVKESVRVQKAEGFHYINMENADLSKIEKIVELSEQVQAPVKKGQSAGRIVYRLGKEEIGSVELVFTDSIKKAGFLDCMQQAFRLLTI